MSASLLYQSLKLRSQRPQAPTASIAHPYIMLKMSSPEKQPTNLFPNLPPYKPPQHGLLSYLPSSWVPYGELMRLSRPIGILIIYCPYLFGTMFAAAVSQPPPSPASTLKTNLVLLIATVFLRGGAVAFNDLADRDLDGKIARTRHRPLARKAITPLSGYIFVLVTVLTVLFPEKTQLHGIDGLKGLLRRYRRKRPDTIHSPLPIVPSCGPVSRCEPDMYSPWLDRLWTNE